MVRHWYSDAKPGMGNSLQQETAPLEGGRLRFLTSFFPDSSRFCIIRQEIPDCGWDLATVHSPSLISQGAFNYGHGPVRAGPPSPSCPWLSSSDADAVSMPEDSRRLRKRLQSLRESQHSGCFAFVEPQF